MRRTMLAVDNDRRLELLRRLTEDAGRATATQAQLHTERSARRRRAVEAVEAGCPIRTVAEAAGVSVARLYQWLAERDPDSGGLPEAG